jgi:hypothetical protein
MAIRNWSVNASENNASPPNGWPEGMAPSAVNDAARKMMADIRTWYEAPEWIDYGFTVAQASPASFTVTGADATPQFHPGRRVRLVGSTTVFGTVATSVYAAPNTTVTVTLDSGSVPSGLSSAQYSATSSGSVPAVMLSGDQSITGVKTFTNIPVIHTGTVNTSLAMMAGGNVRGHLVANASGEMGFINSGYTDWLVRFDAGGAMVAGSVPWSRLTSIPSPFAPSQLGAGTADSTTYLRGDGQWASLPAGTAPTWGSITGTLSSQTDLQSALNGKQNTIVLTASRAVVSDGAGALSASSVTSTQVGYLSGVTSAIQTQLNGKEATLDANRKRQIFVQSGTPSGQATGDLWVW